MLEQTRPENRVGSRIARSACREATGREAATGGPGTQCVCVGVWWWVHKAGIGAGHISIPRSLPGEKLNANRETGAGQLIERGLAVWMRRSR